MQVTINNDMPAVAAENYQLTVLADRPFVYLTGTNGEPLATLFVLSSVHPLSGRDDTTSMGHWRVIEADGATILSVTTGSSVWSEKNIRFCCYPERFTYEVEVVGQGDLADVQLFGGYYSGHVRWGSGFFVSGQSFTQGFNPEPNKDEISAFNADASSTIDLIGVPLPGRSDWFFTPPPFCFAFATADNYWLSMGVEARPGENNFTAYRYRGGRGHFSLAMDYEGHKAVSGRYQLPAIAFDFGTNEYEVLAKHVRALRQANYVPSQRPDSKPPWWLEPSFCGWGAQCHVAQTENGRAPDYARQSLYDQFLETLTSNGIDPGIVVLDDKWQATYGENEVDREKWPDLPDFIHHRHEEGRRVLLWLKAWDPEGVPAEECVQNAAGLPIAIDPTNPAFQQRLRKSVRRMLSADGYDADGFKIDFTARIPSGPGMKRYGDAWGLELLKQYLGVIYTAAKEAKPDALVMTHTPHPYLADVVDMIRLNDINTGKDINRAMRHRACVARIACPSALIDTDNWPVTDRAAWREYLPLQAELGVPSLYYTSHIDSSGEALSAEDYDLIRQTWAQYRQKKFDTNDTNFTNNG
jgi:hypothetical protein